MINVAKTEQDNFLKLSHEEMKSIGYQVIDILADHFDNLHNVPVVQKTNLEIVKTKLNEPIPKNGTSPDLVIKHLQENVFSNVIHHNHPRFFAYVPSPNNFMSAMGDTLASGFNIFSGSYKGSTGPTEIELVTINWLRELCGFPTTAGGLFVSGGTMANLTALTVARHVKLNDKIQNAVIYCSDQTHSSIEKVLRILGFDHKQLNKLPSDENFCLNSSDLKCAIDKDRAAGKRPFCVVATAGTTNTGAIDPLYEISNLCLDEELWLHIDGAYGAASVLCDEGKSKLKGLELCDSLSLDPHKRLFQSYEAGCLLVRNANWLKETFYMQPEYLNDIHLDSNNLNANKEEFNFCDRGIQLTRSFRALKLWISIKTFGLETFQKAISKGIVLAELTERILRESSCWEIVTSAQLGIITFRYIPVNNLSPNTINTINIEIIKKMLADGSAAVSSTKLNNKTVLRMCTINPLTTETDLRKTIQKLDSFGWESSHQLTHK